MLFFDTSDYARQLQKAGFTEHQAEVQMDVLRTLIENDLATKQDIASLQDEIAKLRKETQESIESLRKEAKQDIELLSKETQLGRGSNHCRVGKRYCRSQSRGMEVDYCRNPLDPSRIGSHLDEAFVSLWLQFLSIRKISFIEFNKISLNYKLFNY